MTPSLLLATVLVTAPAPPRERVDLDILADPAAAFIHQDHKDWCAVAGTQMVLAAHGRAREIRASLPPSDPGIHQISMQPTRSRPATASAMSGRSGRSSKMVRDSCAS